jgi:hypothetical protein
LPPFVFNEAARYVAQIGDRRVDGGIH